MAPGYFLLFIIHPLKLCIMTTTNRLCYTVSKRYIQAGTTFEINVKILLADDCKNNICDWSITADIYEQRKNGRFVWCAGDCCHEEILKHFPQFKMFVDLHLSNHYGAPMYPVENGFYHITNSSKETAINYLRITETEYNLLHQAEDKQYFKYLLYMPGIKNGQHNPLFIFGLLLFLFAIVNYFSAFFLVCFALFFVFSRLYSFRAIITIVYSVSYSCTFFIR